MVAVRVDRVLRPAAGLIAVSEQSKADAVRYMRLPPEKIEVIHHGVGDRFFEVEQAEIDRVQTRYQITRPYLFFLSTIEPRKNVDRLIDAYMSLTHSTRQGFDLVLAGPSGWKSRHTLARLQELPHGVRYIGYVPEADLPALTAGAATFVYPSLYEGFGLPVAQAMACGVPVITSNTGSMPEVAGGAALLVDPYSTSEIRDAMEHLLSSPTLQSQLSLAGRTVSQQYRWRIAAQKTWDFFARIAGK